MFKKLFNRFYSSWQCSLFWVQYDLWLQNLGPLGLWSLIRDTANNSQEHCRAAVRIHDLYKLALNLFRSSMLRKDTANYIRGLATGSNAPASSAGGNVAKNMHDELTAHMSRVFGREPLRRWSCKDASEGSWNEINRDEHFGYPRRGTCRQQAESNQLWRHR